MCDATVGRWRAHFAKFKLILSEIRLIDYFDEQETGMASKTLGTN